MLEYESKMRLDTDRLLRGDRDLASASGKIAPLSPIQRVKPVKRIYNHDQKERMC